MPIFTFTRSHSSPPSGAKDSDDFFGQVCAMADPPLAVMTKSKDAGDDLAATSNAVEGAGYEVFYVDTQYERRAKSDEHFV